MYFYHNPRWNFAKFQVKLVINRDLRTPLGVNAHGSRASLKKKYHAFYPSRRFIYGHSESILYNMGQFHNTNNCSDTLQHQQASLLSNRNDLQFADDVSLDGVINFSFVGDDSRPPAYDPPPDYASVVSGDSASNSPTHNQRFLDFLRRIFRRRISVESEVDSIEEEGPPSYSTAIQSLERDLISR
ncbi:hypothetical protein CDAR_501751 [Caerostris darwini]|uniref:Uncharacterized protein n=1 Tax=Caerostris darwini TaxID=1538125 RepID=A0AAV4TRH8_9ARAC|nr:hypothetical protein CDAR_501751 [Caerostris darwini]